MRVQLTARRPLPDRREDSGAIAVLVAIGMTLVLLLAAFAADIGYAYAQGRQLSVAADAAALAAARTLGERYTSTTCTDTGLAALGADALALATARDVVTENSRSGAGDEDITAHAYCSADGTAILVDVTTARTVPTGLGSLAGITSSRPHAEATGMWQRSLVGMLRPWAVCQEALSPLDPSRTVAGPMDVQWGVCGSTSGGNWGSVDFDAQGNPADDLVAWTRFGYLGMPTVPGTIPADPGVSASQLGTAFRSIVNTPILIVVASNYTQASGNNASFQATKLALVTFCGAYYQNQTYATTLSGTASTCWVNPLPATPTYTYVDVPAVGGAMTKNGAGLTVTGPSPFFQAGWANNPDVSVIVAGAGPGGADLASSITTVTDGTTAVLADKATKTVAGAAVTVRLRTLVPPTYVPPAPLSPNGSPYNQLQYRVLRVYETSDAAAEPCTLDDTLCHGVTSLFR